MPRFIDNKQSHRLLAGLATSKPENEHQRLLTITTTGDDEFDEENQSNSTTTRNNNNDDGRKNQQASRSNRYRNYNRFFQSIPEDDVQIINSSPSEKARLLQDYNDNNSVFDGDGHFTSQYYYSDDDDNDDDNNINRMNKNGVSHQSSRIYLKNLFIVATLMMMCTFATCVGIASAYRPSRTGMVGRRDVHPNRNLHVVTESLDDVHSSKLVIEEYIKRKKEAEADYEEYENGQASLSAATSMKKKSTKKKAGGAKEGKQKEEGNENKNKNMNMKITSVENDVIMSDSSSVSKKKIAKKKKMKNGQQEEIQKRETLLNKEINLSPKALLKTVLEANEVEKAIDLTKNNKNLTRMRELLIGDDVDSSTLQQQQQTSEEAVSPGKVNVLGPGVKNSIESIELISSATSANAQSWGLDESTTLQQNDEERE